MLAVTELCGKLGLIEALDEAMGPVKQRARGFTGGQVLAGMAASSWPGRTSWWAWTGCAPTPPGSRSRRCRAGHLDRDRASAPVHRQALAGRRAGGGGDWPDDSPAARRAGRGAGRRAVTIDIDATEPGDEAETRWRTPTTARQARLTPARPPRPRSRWPPTCWPRPTRTPARPSSALLGRALAALPQRSGSGGGGRADDRAARRRLLRPGPGPRRRQGGHRVRDRRQRITSMWKALAGIAEDAWRTP